MDFWRNEQQLVHMFSQSNKIYFENLSDYKPKDTEIRKILFDILRNNNEWKIKKENIWFVCRVPKSELPNKGWKIHVSSDINSAIEVLKIVSEICVKFKVSFKVVCDLHMLRLINSKLWPRGSSGKFITIYPPSKEIFKKIIHEIYLKTKKFAGPYILSDKRYKDSKVVYYRYGGFRTNFIINSYGEKIPIIYNPQGNIYVDERAPFYKIPPWEKEPFEEEKKSKSEESENDVVLNSRYKILSAIKHSNAGGVYKAQDLISGNTVLIKEARPYVYFGNKTAEDSLKKEFKILKKIEKYSIGPRAYSIFREWEHLFIAEEYLDGIPLSRFFSLYENRLFLYPELNKKLISEFHHIFKKVCLAICETLEILHKEGIVFGDLSPENILLVRKNDNLKAKLIDFEGANEIKQKFHNILFTPGFGDILRDKKKVSVEDDYYSLGKIILFMIFPLNKILLWDKKISQFKKIKEVVNDAFLPEEIYYLIKNLISSEKRRRFKIEEIKNTIKKIKLNSVKYVNFKHKTRCKFPIKRIEKDLKEIINYIIYTFKEYRRNNKGELFPLDPRAFITNDLNIAYGDGGVVYTLKRTGFLTPEIEKYFTEKCKKTDLSILPPGFYVGTAGISWILSDLGYLELAERFIEHANSSSLLRNIYDITHGISGVGLANLNFYFKTGNNKYLEKSFEFGYKLLKDFKNKKEFSFVHPDGDVYFGFALGSSGIAYFLLLLYCLSKDSKFLKYGENFLDFDIKNLVSIENFLTSKISKNNQTLVPYFYHGSSGIGTAILKYWYITGNEYYNELLYKIALDSKRKYSVFVGQFVGLAGLGEFLLDLTLFKKEKTFRFWLKEVLEGINIHKIKSDKGIFFPGRALVRINVNYANGSSGVALFLNRILKKETRDFMLDKIILSFKND